MLDKILIKLTFGLSALIGLMLGSMVAIGFLRIMTSIDWGKVVDYIGVAFSGVYNSLIA